MQKGIITLKWLPTESMPADVLTKALSAADHNRLCSILMGREVLIWPTTSSGSKAGGMMSSRKRGRSTDTGAVARTPKRAR